MKVFFLAFLFFLQSGALSAQSRFDRRLDLNTDEPIEVAKIAKKLATLQGKTLILGKGVAGKVSIITQEKVSPQLAYQIYLLALQELGFFLQETSSVLKIASVNEAVNSAEISQSLDPYRLNSEVVFYVSQLKSAHAKDILRFLNTNLGAKNVFELQENFLVLIGPQYHLKNLMKTVKFLDDQTSEKSSLKIFHLKHASAKEVHKTLKALDLFGSKSSHPSSQLLHTKMERILFGFGSKEFHEKILKAIEKLDTPSNQKKGKRFFVRPIEFADIKKVAAVLQDLKKKPSKGDSTEASLQDFDVTIDEENSALLIKASRDDYDILNGVIQKMDKRKAQVLFLVDILNIQEGFKFKFSTSNMANVNANGEQFGVLQGWQAEKVLPVVTDNRGEGEAISETALGSKINALSEDVVLGILTKDKFQVNGMTGISPGALISLFKSDEASQTLSSPMIMSLDGEEASLVVGDSIHYKVTEVAQGPSSQLGVSSSMVQTKIEKEDAEIALNLTPQVDSAASVTLNLDLKVKTLVGTNKDGYPQLVTRNVKQKIALRNEQTIFISGFKTAEEFETLKKVPFLGDVPLLSLLFRYKSNHKTEGRIMIFITPYIVWGEADMKRLQSNQLKDRLARFPEFKKKADRKGL